MCTVTVIALDGGGLRLVSNRDEQRTRRPAGPPQEHALQGGAVGIWPVDPDAGGTWIAASDHLAMTLLNGNPEPPADLSGVTGLRSRGVLIPELIGSDDAEAAVSALESIDLSVFAPFRLVFADAPGGTARVIDACWDRKVLHITRHGDPAVCFASSGLGDSKVCVRLPLFEQTVVPEPTPGAQDAFHRHVWSDRPEVSVMMTRADARTVSITAVEIRPGSAASMAYESVEEPAQAR